jgi:hypothetical protein
MGGFGESKPLRAHLRKAPASFNDARDSNTALYVADEEERSDALPPPNDQKLMMKTGAQQSMLFPRGVF